MSNKHAELSDHFEDVVRVPFGIYGDPEIRNEEEDRIFRGPVWCFVGLEAEIPNPGDHKMTYVGETPVILVRDKDDGINVLVNRCAHRGNLVCTKERGNSSSLTCVYHNWVYGLDGSLKGVAFQRGTAGKGGMPEEFDRSQYRMPKLRTATYCGLVFATFSDETPDLETFLGAEMLENMDRVIGRKMKLLGYYSQYMPNDWKLYMENVKDSYHASLLHLFQATFKINRLSMKGGIKLSDNGWHHISYSIAATDQGDEEYDPEKLRSMSNDIALKDPTLIKGWQEFPCGTTLAIQGVFPNLVVQQITNSIAVRLCLPKGPDHCELLWWILGTEDDTDEQEEMRIKQSNMIGPGGVISMEDGVVGGWVQRASEHDPNEQTLILMGGRDVKPSEEGRATEVAIRGFWKGYRELMAI